MQEMIALMNEKVSDFDMEDWTLLKATLILFGVIVGATFATPCKKLKPLLVIIWMCCFAYLMIKLFVLTPEEEY